MNAKIKAMLISIIIMVIISMFFLIVLVFDTGYELFKNDEFQIKYDNNWNVLKKSSSEVTLNHKSNSRLNIKVDYLGSQYRKTELESLIENIMIDVEKENPEYRLVNKEQALISEQGYEGYKYLYENDYMQALINVFKKNDKIIIITYFADHSCFDILLDSVNDIIWNFKMLI